MLEEEIKAIINIIFSNFKDKLREKCFEVVSDVHIVELKNYDGIRCR